MRVSAGRVFKQVAEERDGWMDGGTRESALGNRSPPKLALMWS